MGNERRHSDIIWSPFCHNYSQLLNYVFTLTLWNTCSSGATGKGGSSIHFLESSFWAKVNGLPAISCPPGSSLAPVPSPASFLVCMAPGELVATLGSLSRSLDKGAMAKSTQGSRWSSLSLVNKSRIGHFFKQSLGKCFWARCYFASDRHKSITPSQAHTGEVRVEDTS